MVHVRTCMQRSLQAAHSSSGGSSQPSGTCTAGALQKRGHASPLELDAPGADAGCGADAGGASSAAWPLPGAEAIAPLKGSLPAALTEGTAGPLAWRVALDDNGGPQVASKKFLKQAAWPLAALSGAPPATSAGSIAEAPASPSCTPLGTLSAALPAMSSIAEASTCTPRAALSEAVPAAPTGGVAEAPGRSTACCISSWPQLSTNPSGQPGSAPRSRA